MNILRFFFRKLVLITFFCLLHNYFYAQDNTVVNKGIVSVQAGTDNIILSDFVNESTANFVNDGNVVYKGNFSNAGNFAFNEMYEGVVNFEGEEQQVLTLNTSADFKNIIFNNASTQPAFDLTGDMYVFGEADFYKGIVNLNSGGVFFDENATHINEDDDSHVDGVCIRFGESEFDFPVGGNSYLREASISSSEDVNSIFSAEYFYENSDLLFPHSNRDPKIALIDNTEYWTVDKLDGNNNVILTLSWHTNTTPSDITSLNEGEEIHIVRWDANSGKWIDEGGIMNTSSKTVSTPIQIGAYGVFTLAKVYVSTDVIVYNAITPDSNGKNDYLIIEGLENYPNNTLSVFNRWGRIVYKTQSYNTANNIFNGYANVNTVLNNELASGTYFYVLEYKNAAGNSEKKTGFLYLNERN
ncbi:MAG: gliding motility-associated C-terminal domain-containing protein [Flavobacteriaceae bacterium]